jgi:hypothetical protein
MYRWRRDDEDGDWGDEESMISLSSKVEGRQGEGRVRDVGFNFGEGREEDTHTH